MKMLGENLFWLRRAAGMTQAELASRVHVSPSSIGMYEQNRRIPNLDVLISLSDCFGVTLDELVRKRCALSQDFLPDTG